MERLVGGVEIRPWRHLSLLALVLLFGIVRGLGQESIGLCALALRGIVGLRLGVDFLGTGPLLLGVRGCLLLSSARDLLSRSGSTALDIIIFQLGTVHIGVLTEAILHAPGELLVTQSYT